MNVKSQSELDIREALKKNKTKKLTNVNLGGEGGGSKIFDLSTF